ncbi:MAG: SprT family zinc-dependent metalloprotease [Paracoccaceae bacterium]
MQVELPGDPGLVLNLRRSARARRFSLRVSRLDGRVTLSMPLLASDSEAMRFAHSQAEWIRQAQSKAAVQAPVALGTSIPFEGRMLVLTPAEVRAPIVLGNQLLLPPDPARAAVRVAAFLKLQAQQRLQAASDHYAGLVGRRHAGLTLRDTRSRWGSCAADGALMYSWRLIMAPTEVLDYVAAHEVAHLVEMNHSPAFWAVVRRLMPDYQQHRRWLKREGNRLHSYDFKPG